MSNLNGRISRLEQASLEGKHKQRLVLYYDPPDRYANVYHEYTTADLPRLREEFDLMIIHVVRPEHHSIGPG